jgi:TolB-like protein
MKRFITVLIMAIIVGNSVCFGQTSIPAIVVSGFTTRGQALTADDAESITELFVAELAKTGKLRVVDRTSLDRVIAEMNFQLSDWSNPQKTGQLGSALNAEYMVRGQLNQLGDRIIFVLTAQDIRTLEVVSSSNEQFSIASIFDGSKNNWGQYLYNNIFDKMPNMAEAIAGTISTKLANTAETRQKEAAERERQRQEELKLQEQNSYSLVGTWSATRRKTLYDLGNKVETLTITFSSDGSLSMSIDRWEEESFSKANWLVTDMYDFAGYEQKNTFASGKGFYSRTGNKLEISINMDGTILVSKTDKKGRNSKYDRTDSYNKQISGNWNIDLRNNGNTFVLISGNGIYNFYEFQKR